MVSFGLVLFLSGLCSLVYNRKHMLALLLSLELMMLGVFLVMMNFVLASMVELIVFYLVLVVCEASLGLGVLVMSVYFYGSDQLSSFSILSC
uniref:NADH dehydrogenase subunit 4L n=1 Tax=Parasitus fimetorum TaxID=2022322 RepID=UPI001FAF278A|nr:NADH dehydrogenase subunit 4L [Parasitus fimetorum]UKO33178.1 NADH dehydrogenase subunit 4L [Parasitus fimetorum]